MKYRVIDENGYAVEMVLMQPRPFPSWTLNQQNEWEPPVALPSGDKWGWSEENQEWETYE